MLGDQSPIQSGTWIASQADVLALQTVVALATLGTLGVGRSLYVARDHCEQENRGRPAMHSATPPRDLPSLAAGRSASTVRWVPLSQRVYDQMPAQGKALQRRFYENLRTGLSGLRQERGRALVVIPARNEALNIAETLNRALASEHGHRGVEFAIVNNASTDHTLQTIRAWADDRRAVVELVDHASGRRDPIRTAAANSAGKLVLHLLDQPRPGKANALLAVEAVFHDRGAYPEWIAQLDADSALVQGTVGQLIEIARSRGQVAATAAQRARVAAGQRQVRIPSTDAESPGILYGGFFVARTRPFLAGYRAIVEEYPQSAAEDTLLTALFRLSGLKTGAATPEVKFETLAASTYADALAQQIRWRTGHLQASRVFGEKDLASIGLFTNRRAAFEKSLRENHHWRNLADYMKISVGARRALRRADREGAYSWIPPRGSEQP
jgi:Glycosyl transferase family 2